MAKLDTTASAAQNSRKPKTATGKRKGKKEADGFDWREDKRAPAEPAAKKMLPGGHKNMKQLWICRHEKEQAEASQAAAQAEKAAEKDDCTSSVAQLPDSQSAALSATVRADTGPVAALDTATAGNSTADKDSTRGKLLSRANAHKQAVRAEAEANAAAGVAREAAERELAEAAETRAKQHVEDSMAKESKPPGGAEPVPHNGKHPPSADSARLQPLTQEPAKKRKREVTGPLGSVSIAAPSQVAPATAVSAAEPVGPADTPKVHPSAGSDSAPPKHRASLPSKAMLPSNTRRPTVKAEVGADVKQQTAPLHHPGPGGSEQDRRPSPSKKRVLKQELDQHTSVSTTEVLPVKQPLAQAIKSELDRGSGAGDIDGVNLGDSDHKAKGRQSEVSSPSPDNQGLMQSGARVGVPSGVEVWDVRKQSSPVGTLDLASLKDCRQLQMAIKEKWGPSLGLGSDFKLVYQDLDGDLLLLQPNEAWSSIVSSAQRVIIACK